MYRYTYIFSLGQCHAHNYSQPIRHLRESYQQVFFVVAFVLSYLYDFARADSVLIRFDKNIYAMNVISRFSNQFCHPVGFFMNHESLILCMMQQMNNWTIKIKVIYKSMNLCSSLDLTRKYLLEFFKNKNYYIRLISTFKVHNVFS